jgi:hypothetical protein
MTTPELRILKFAGESCSACDSSRAEQGTQSDRESSHVKGTANRNSD